MIGSSITAPMIKGDTITVTFHNVKVRDLRPRELATSEMIEDEILVTDDIAESMYDVSIMMEPLMQSDVSVNLDEVDQGDVVDITVTYIVNEDMLFGPNNIFIGLPLDWGAAYRASGSHEDETTTSFGGVVLSDEPSRSERARTSYVVLESDFKSTSPASPAMIDGHDLTATTPTFLDIGASGYNAYVYIPVTGGMVKGDVITVTFNNVMVEELEATKPMPVPLIVRDSIPGSNYTSDVTIQVIPPKLGNVLVTVTPDPVTAEATVDLKVRYTATKVLADDDTLR